MNTLYIAAPYAARDHVRGYAAQASRIGYDITATWLAETHKITDGATGPATALTDDEVDHHARTDLADIDRAQTLVLITEAASGINLGIFGPPTSGGRHVETGYFIARHGVENVVVVGEPENVFHRLDGITVVPSWHEAVVELAARLNQPTTHTEENPDE